MPRIIFNEYEQYLNWIEAHCTPARYEFYVTATNEVIAAPTKATPPHNYGYQRLSSDFINKLVEGLKAKGFNVFEVNNFDWDTQRGLTQ